MLKVESRKYKIKELKKVFEKKMLEKSSDQIQCYAGYRGGRELRKLYWWKEEKIWMTFSHADGNRFWNAFGTTKPIQNGTVSITVEINFPYSGINRNIGAIFLTDNREVVYLAHRGQLGGGRTGIGKKLFFENISSEEVQIVKDGEQESKVFIIGDLSSNHFPVQVSSFIRRVDDIKKRLGKINNGSKLGQSYSPEFFGEKSYDVKKTIKSNCDHGRIVDSLKREILTNFRYEGFNDVQRDLYISDDNHQLSLLFEVKTVLSSYHLYTAVGQLFCHKVKMNADTKKVVVLPTFNDRNVNKILQKLNITLVQYELKGSKVLFKGLSNVFA